ncbi:hypothetical protein QIW53_22590 [Pseudomonas fluorescens]|uniref:hypothetical protein n=1 Tax=Pseudomonas fluorescens TaxID=294 RepID=UPI0035240F05
MINVNKELPVQSGLTLDECKTAAAEALADQNNFARCLPAPPAKPYVLVKLPSGLIVEAVRKHGGYTLGPEYSPEDRNFLATALGKPSSGVHGKVHGPAKQAAHYDEAKVLASE